MYKEIDLNNWKRKSQFDFFKDYDIPFFNITADVDVTNLHRFCKSQKSPFFLSLLFYSTKAINEIEEFRYRIKGDGVICYDKIDAGSTILMDDNTFSFCYFEYIDDLQQFIEVGNKEIETLKKKKCLDPKLNADNLIHYSSIPWISFTSVQHARKLRTGDSIPKLVFGKFYKDGHRLNMPLSVEVHHALLDGYHVSEYFKKYQGLMDSL